VLGAGAAAAAAAAAAGDADGGGCKMPPLTTALGRGDDVVVVTSPGVAWRGVGRRRHRRRAAQIARISDICHSRDPICVARHTASAALLHYVGRSVGRAARELASAAGGRGGQTSRDRGQLGRRSLSHPVASPPASRRVSATHTLHCTS